ncbi:TPA: acyl-ACP--UDP-N-acetylglucosamine O-acyltransferase [Serratia fonticola]|nr:acyl-ACP--UDP-N-acetylglucosamine O-acyltransferase [Serratia fonticola]
MSISPSARVASSSLIEPGAIIGARVSIGPFCIIAAGVEIGDDTVIASHVSINGLTRIGCNNVIGQFSTIGEVNQDLKYAGEATDVIIGDRNRIGKNATIHRGTAQGYRRTTIGNDNLFLNNVHIGHDCIVGNTTVIGDNSGLAGHVELDDFVQIGNICAIHQFCLLGAHAHIAHQSGVVQDVPPFVSASGNHAAPIGVNESAAAFQSLDDRQQQVIQALYNMLYHNALAIDEVKQEAQRLSEIYPLLQWFTSFFSRSARGIIR